MTVDHKRAEPLMHSRRVASWPWLRAMRPKQWTKNAVVFAALVFDLRLGEPDYVAKVVGAFILFCLVSSAIYLLNDLHDVESDRAHPTKRSRPVASGQLSTSSAWIIIGALALVAIVGGALLSVKLAAVLAAYLTLMVAYTYVFKHLVILDVFAISAGFVLRAAAGAVVIDVPISPWLYVCTVLLSLFIGFGKRRHELLLLEGSAGAHRRNLDDYSPQLLDQFIVISAAATVMAYSLYTFAATNLPANQSMMITIPFVVYAIFRYLFLVHRREGGGSPEQMLLGDLPLLSGIALWGVVSVIILYASG